MERTEVTRRQILAGVAGAGGVGAVVGTGTASVFSDETVFRRSTFGSGRLDLAVAWETDDGSGQDRGSTAIPVSLSPGDPRQTIDLTVSVPDDDENNPVAAWIRAVCPDQEPPGFDLDVTLRHRDCPADCVLYTGSLAGLADGIALDPDGRAAPGDQGCLAVGEELDLALDVGATDFGSTGDGRFTLEFVGVQCRNRDPTAPFGAADRCGDADGPDRPAVSFVAFCWRGDESVRPSIPATEPGDDGPDVVFWETAIDVEYVCVKGAGTLTVYDHQDVHRTSGVAWVGDPEAAVPSLSVEPGDAARPCEIANRELGTNDATALRSIKLEPANSHWEVRGT